MMVPQSDISTLFIPRVNFKCPKVERSIRIARILLGYSFASTTVCVCSYRFHKLRQMSSFVGFSINTFQFADILGMHSQKTVWKFWLVIKSIVIISMTMRCSTINQWLRGFDCHLSHIVVSVEVRQDGGASAASTSTVKRLSNTTGRWARGRTAPSKHILRSVNKKMRMATNVVVVWDQR